MNRTSDMTKDQILAHSQEHGLRRALIVTALALEMRAVRAHLAHLGSVVGRAGTIYECGQFSARGAEWLVIVAESGAGTHPAQQVVMHAHIDFENFEVVIFAGVAGSRKEEAVIGSVIASSLLYLPQSGKYDPQFGFTARPHSLPVDRRLIGCAQKVERDAEWPTRIRPPLRGTLPAEVDYPKPLPPAAFVAPIASSEAVSADPNSDLELLITQHYGDAYAIEMEGYGAAYAGYTERTPLIVVRGISDMRGGKTPKNDAIHQPVAAAHAAAFAFELLDTWGRFHPRDGVGVRTASVVRADGDASVSSPSPTASDGSAGSLRQVIVLNFDGTLSEFTTERVEQILEALKAQSRDQSLRVVRAEEGSVRLFIEGQADSLDRIDVPETYAMLLRDFEATLLGVLSEDDYRKAQSIDDVLQRASRDLLGWPQKLPDGTHLQRPEFDQLFSIFDENESSTTALLGPPGSGKSALLASVGQELAKRKAAFMAIKADLLDPAIQTEEDLKSALSLPDSLSALLIRLSHLRPVVLLIDQLDALAGYVDLRTGRLSALLNVVRELGGRRNIHIVLSARTFEYEHDTRLKAVRADNLMLTLPPWSTVLQVLEGHGIEAAGWPVDAQEVMRVPQALATFLKLNERANEPPFRTYQSMLDQLWKDRVLGQPNGARIAKLAGTIAENMAERETLWLAAAKFDDASADLRTLIASGILTDYDGTAGRVGFSHQTVFEHALARAFARGEGRLSRYVLERQASLFVRPKLWAALTYLREVEPSTYQSELQTLWGRSDLRLHLRHMLIELLGQQAAPTTVEIGFFESALKSDNRRVALQALMGSPGWFDLFKLTHISSAMSDEKEAGVATAILDKAWTFAPDAVTALIRRNWLPHSSFDGQAWQLLQGFPKWSDDVTQIALTIIDRTKIAPMFFEHTISTVGVDQPEIALKLISAKLSCELRDAVQKAEELAALTPPEEEDKKLVWHMTHSPYRPIIDVFEQNNGWDTLESLAKDNGKLFLHYVWPPFQDALAALRRVWDESSRFGFSIPYHLDLRFDGEHSLGLQEHPLLGAIAVAVQSFAGSDERDFLTWLATHEHEDATPAQRLFAHALAAHPERYAMRARTFLLGDARRFYLGSSEDWSGTTKRLVGATSPFWPDDALSAFVERIMAYAFPLPTDLPPKNRRYVIDTVRRTKLGILSSLPADRLSKEVRKYIEEEHRRFPDEKVGARFYGPTAIGSPMSAHSMARASDADIVKAFREIPDATGWDHPTGRMKGGNIQLSRAFSEFAKNEPNRAIRIIEQFEPLFGTRAAGYALDAMAETAEPAVILALIKRLDERGFTGSEFRDGAANAVGRLVQRDVQIGDETLAVLEGWLAEPSPDAEESEQETEEDEAIEPSESGDEKEQETASSTLWGYGGFAILPHGRFPTLQAVTRSLLARPDCDRLVDLYVKHLQVNEREDVWQALLRDFQYIRPTNPAIFGNFILDLFERYPDLSSTREAAVMLAYLQWRSPDVVRQVVSNWKGESGRLQQTYGELVALIAIVQPGLEWPPPMLDEILAVDEMASARVGAAYTAVNLWSEIKHRQAASQLLRSIIPKADADAWTAIFDLFRLVDEITPEEEWVSLLRVMSEYLPNARNLDSSFVIERLQTLLPHEANLVAEIARTLVANWRDEVGDIRTGTSMMARDLVDLAITLHRLGPETREAGTSLFEDLLVVSAYTARETLDEIDNRFRGTARSAQRRLPRRARRARTRTQTGT